MPAFHPKQTAATKIIEHLHIAVPSFILTSAPLTPPHWYQTVVRSFRTSERREADIVGKPVLVEFDRICVR